MTVATVAPASSLTPSASMTGLSQSISKLPRSLPCSCCWVDAGTARPRKHQRCHPRAARPGPQDCPTHSRGWDEEEVQLDAVHVGDRLRVRPGEKVPVDGEVIEGRSACRR
ncbi:hypothetical protein [Paracoccus sp. WLY502]|uniref:P-type ATPase n=1 Tax=Paracoccus yibinensis TaxID=3068891 RepID=UPI00358FD130